MNLQPGLIPFPSDGERNCRRNKDYDILEVERWNQLIIDCME